MTDEELEKKSKKSYWNSDANGGLSSEKNYKLGFIAGAKELQKENEQLAQENKRAKVLLKATLDLLQKQKDSCYVLNLLEETSFYDKADCDGYCLFGDIEIFLNFGS